MTPDRATQTEKRAIDNSNVEARAATTVPISDDADKPMARKTWILPIGVGSIPKPRQLHAKTSPLHNTLAVYECKAQVSCSQE